MRFADTMLECIGINARQYRALVRALILMDLRSQHYGRATGSKPSELIPPLYWVVGQFLFVSAICSAILFGRVAVESFVLVNLTVSIMLGTSSVIVEFNEVVLDVGDLDILGPRPISRRTYAAARLTNLGFYMGLIITAVSIFPTIMGAGLRDAGPGFLLTYLLASVVGTAGFMLLAIIIYSLAPPSRDRRDLRDMLAWIQIIVALVAFYGAQLMLRDSGRAIETFLDRAPSWFVWIPSAWLASAVAAAATHPVIENLRWAAAALLGLGLLAIMAWLRLMTYYSRAQTGSIEAKLVRSPSRSRRLIGPWAAKLAGRGSCAGPVALCLLMLRRDQDLRLRTWPALAPIMVFFCIGLCLKELADPMAGNSSRGGFSIAVVQLVVLAVPTIIHNMGYSRDHVASWLFLAAPQRRRTVYAEASRRAACHGVLLPVMVGLWVGFSILWRNPIHAAVHCGLGWLAVLAASHFTLWGMHYPLPFARPAARGAATGPVLPYLAGVGTLATAVGGAEYGARASWLWLSVLGLALLGLASLSSRLALRERLAKEVTNG